MMTTTEISHPPTPDQTSLSPLGAARIERARQAAAEFWESPSRMQAGIAQILEPIDAQHKRRDARLRLLLHHAKARSPWHARRLAHVDPDKVSGDDLSMIPVMTKADLMTNWDDIVTDRAVTLAAASAHLDRLRRGEWDLLHDRYAVLASGGTTGTRGVYLFDLAIDERPSVPDFAGGMDRFWAWQASHAGRSAGDRFVRARVMSTAPFHVSSVWRWIYGESETDRYLPASAPIPELVEMLNSIDPTMLCTYPSVGHRLALEAAAGRLRIRPRTVTTSGEPLLPEARVAMEDHFGADVSQEYASTESYMTAWNVVNPGLHFVEDDGVFEPVDRGAAPVPPGRPSAAILVTNLWSFALPLIRFELTDEVVVDPAPNPGPLPGRRVLSVNGRSDDWFTYDGAEVHPHTFRAVLGSRPAVAEYQVRQTPRGADVAVVAAERLVEADIADELEVALRRAGLERPEVTIRVVDRLDRHGETAKLRRFVPRTDRPSRAGTPR